MALYDQGERRRNLVRVKDQKLYGGLWAPGVEDRTHELRDVRGCRERIGSILVHLPMRWLRGSMNTRLQKDISGHKAECWHKGGIYFYFIFIFPLVCFCDRVETSQIRI